MVTRFQGFGAGPTNTLRSWPSSITSALAIIKPLARVADPARPMGLDATPGYQFMEAVAHFAHLDPVRAVVDPIGFVAGHDRDVLRVFRTAWNGFRAAACGRGGDAATLASVVGTLISVASLATQAMQTDITRALTDVASRLDQLREEVLANECPAALPSSGNTIPFPRLQFGIFQQPPAEEEKKMSTGSKVAIWAGVIAIVGAVAYAMK